MFDVSDFLIDQFSNKVYQLVGNLLVDEYGNKHVFDPDVHTKLVMRTDTILLFNYMKRRVFHSDLICAVQNIGTKFERWWSADRFSPEGRVYSADGSFSCRVQDAFPLKANDPTWLFNNDTLEMETWLLQVTSTDEYTRLKASQLLLKRYAKFQESLGNSINKFVM